MLTESPFLAEYEYLLKKPGAILLHTSRVDDENYHSYLFAHPVRVLRADTLEQVPGVLAEIQCAVDRGQYIAGYMGYECGLHFESIERSTNPHLSLRSGWGTRLGPLAWFGVYPQAYVFDHRTGQFVGCTPEPGCNAAQDTGFQIRKVQFGLAEQDYVEKIEAIREYIRAGDTYQVNFTDNLSFDFSGSAVALFAALSAQQRVSYGAYLNLGNRQILSLSPELFFRVRDGRIWTRPMKGTARRGFDRAEDAGIAEWLRNDAKNRAENVMIVDLLRNDLGRVCRFGSVRVDKLFAIEKYETLFQMTSTVSGELRTGLNYCDMFRSLFPCGSVTGAPKIRSMEIIRELERGPRGVYTGAIGFFAPHETVFNVAIRTVVLQEGRGEMGIGSGVTYDSNAQDEYRECLLKAEFLTRREQPFQLIETLLWEGEYKLLPLHIDRLAASAEYFDFCFEREAVIRQLESAAASLLCGTRYKVRLLLDRAGVASIEASSVSDIGSTGKVTVSSVRTSSGDRFLRHKTTHRKLYDELYAQARDQGFDDVLFMNERGEITEGAISNVFAEIGGKLCTPPVSCGLLPGVFRRHLIETNRAAEERVLSLKDIEHADAIYICNAVRGVRKAELKTGCCEWHTSVS